MEGYIVKLNVSFDPVKLVTSLRETIDLGLLWATRLRRRQSAKLFGLNSPQLHKSGCLTLSIVSKMMVAAPRPAANASRQGEACPKFMAAIKTPKKTWRKSGKCFTSF